MHINISLIQKFMIYLEFQSNSRVQLRHVNERRRIKKAKRGEKQRKKKWKINSSFNVYLNNPSLLGLNSYHLHFKVVRKCSRHIRSWILHKYEYIWGLGFFLRGSSGELKRHRGWIVVFLCKDFHSSCVSSDPKLFPGYQKKYSSRYIVEKYNVYVKYINLKDWFWKKIQKLIYKNLD